MNKKFLKKIMLSALMLIAVACITAPVIASADSRSDYRAAQEKLNAINREVSSLKSTTSEKKKAQQAAARRVTLVKDQISILNDEIEQANSDLLAKQEELENKKTEIEQTDELFKERLKAMYMMRNSSTMSTILGANTVSELLTATDTLQRVSVRDTELLQLLDTEKQQIETEEAEIETKITELDEKQKTLESKQTELRGYLQTANSELTEAQAEQQAAEETQSEVYRQYLRAKNAYESEIRSAIAEGSTQRAVGGDYIWPVPTNGSISSPFGWRVLYGKNDYHTGIDINTGSGPYILGKTIIAAKRGTVVRAIYGSTGYGYYVMIDHGGGYYSLYGHCSALYVKVGDVVTQGQAIARVGSTGNSTGPHLHYEMRINGTATDPLPYVRATRPSIR